MSLKKFRAKTHKSSVKRIKVSKGGNPENGKLQVSRSNRSHRLIGKQRERMLKGKTVTKLSTAHDKFRKVI
jgi:ribosomal protein L35